MLDSILKRRAEPVNFEKIIFPNKILTDKNEIKEATRLHFKNWTKENPPNNTNWKKWKSTYNPLDNIKSNIYNNLLFLISISELEQTIKEAPKRKATGPLGIANKVLQHLPSSALLLLLEIFNKCLIQECIPDQWLQANIWPIPKKQHYNYELNSTQPITLIDHTRKIFTKILTTKLTNILVQNQVLFPYNFAAFPH
jgi:hypothetical protein